MIAAESISKSAPVPHTSPSPSGAMALYDVSTEIPEGSLSGLLGPAGSGTSTLAAILGLHDAPDSGVVRFNGVDPVTLDAGKRRELRARIGRVDSRYVLHPERTAAGNIAAPLERAGLDGPARRKRVAELIDLIGLTRGAARRPAELSEGQRRRVALARALATRPSLLIAEELTDDLDGEQSGGVLAALDRAWAEYGITVLVATTDAGVVRKICDHVSVLSGGRLVESGALLELIGDEDSVTARSVLPAVAHSGAATGFDRLVDVVLVGHATVASVLGEAGTRFGVELSTLGGGVTRVGDTPVGRFRLGLSGADSDAALRWISEHGGRVSEADLGMAGVDELLAHQTRSLAGVAV
ncbi:ATP-binding cassette domain-containing protein [Haloechinothrix aidingensis]